MKIIRGMILAALAGLPLAACGIPPAQDAIPYLCCPGGGGG